METKYATRLEYIWLDKDSALRSKVKIVPELDDTETPPMWSFDGSSTGQASGSDSDCFIEPIRSYPNPFEDGYLVLCQVRASDMEPHETNQREKLAFHGTKPNWWFAFEQEYFLKKNGTILGWPHMKDINGKPMGEPRPQGDYYCGVGSANVVGRKIVEEHMSACLVAGLGITGTNAEVALGQWEYQVFAEGSLQAADDLWVSRYILHRICEKYEVDVEFHPKPVEGDWNGSGCHMNFSNDELREIGGLSLIEKMMKKLQITHDIAMKAYGDDNEMRLTGKHETQHYSKFSYGECDRGASIRIPSYTVQNYYRGYLEDRRPASNVDPYKAILFILNTLGG